MINALDKIGCFAQSLEKLITYPERQRKDGFFLSQNGEWDSNGQAIWSMMEHYRLTGDREFLKKVYPSIRKGIYWIERKRKKTKKKREAPHYGLLPPGLSAEHLGPNDYYYWDDFWSLAGIRDGIESARILGRTKDQAIFEGYYKDFWKDILNSLKFVEQGIGRPILPASPYRRMDAGAIGSICALYPLRLLSSDDERIINTIEYLRKESFYKDGFFQHMIHSGVNPYLTAQIAQCYLFRRSSKAWPLIRYLMEIATSTYTWPEAVHPRTGGGCMGDGHHGWAMADWILLIRNLLLFEEEGALVLTPALPPEWFYNDGRIFVENAPTYFGIVGFEITWVGEEVRLHLHTRFRTSPTNIEWNLPFEAVERDSDGTHIGGRGGRIILSNDTHNAIVHLKMGARMV